MLSCDLLTPPTYQSTPNHSTWVEWSRKTPQRHTPRRPALTNTNSNMLIYWLVKFVIETGEVIYITITNHSKTAGSVTHRHTIACADWKQQNMFNTLPPNVPQPERTARLMIEVHISSSGSHILTLLNQINTTLLYHWIPNGITPHTYLFPPQRRHVCSSIGIHAHTSCRYPSYQ